MGSAASTQATPGLECHCKSHATRAGLTSYKENAGPQTIDVLAEAKSLIELEGSKSKICSAGREETTSANFGSTQPSETTGPLWKYSVTTELCMLSGDRSSGATVQLWAGGC